MHRGRIASSPLLRRGISLPVLSRRGKNRDERGFSWIPRIRNNISQLTARLRVRPNQPVFGCGVENYAQSLDEQVWFFRATP